MARVYVEKARHVNADQFIAANTPWPPAVIVVDGVPMVEFPYGIRVPIQDGDWLTEDVRSHVREVLSDAAFQDRYGTGPT